MLDPEQRQMFIEALRPPPRTTLDCAVGTTFTLDLVSLLIAPISFTLFDWDEGTHLTDLNPVALLDALRQHSEKISLFCQAGRIRVPSSYHWLLTHLEDSIHEVNLRRRSAAFHPKVWVLRFMTGTGDVQYRVIVMSRNLTFDRSWDLMLVLDGTLTDRVYAYSRNHPLGDLIQFLSRMTQDNTTTERMALMQHEIRRVRFDLPGGFTDYRFWAPGITGSRVWPFGNRSDRRLVVSPFLSPGTLENLTASGSDHVLITEPHAAGQLDAEIREKFTQTFVLDDSITPDTEPDHEGSENIQDELDHELTGLHAKLYVAELGAEATMWVGSANATDAAFHGNVEFLVELTGPKRMCGVDACLDGSSGRVCFRELLVPFIDSEPEEDSERAELERKLESGRQALIDAEPRLEVSENSEDTYRCNLVLGAPLSIPDDLTVRCWPVTVEERTAAQLLRMKGEPAARFTLSLLSLTRFVAFEVSIRECKDSSPLRFVLNLPARGMPCGRQEQILAHVLRNREGVLRYLLMLLADTGLATADGDMILGDGSAWSQGWMRGGGDLPLLETLMQALDRDPARLDRVARLLEDLRRVAPELLPRDIQPVWDVVWKVRKGLTDE